MKISKKEFKRPLVLLYVLAVLHGLRGRDLLRLEPKHRK